MFEANKFYIRFIKWPDEECADICHVGTYDDGRLYMSYDLSIYADGIVDGDDSCNVEHIEDDSLYTELSLEDLHKINQYISNQKQYLRAFAMKSRIRENRNIKEGDYMFTSDTFYHLNGIEEGYIDAENVCLDERYFYIYEGFQGKGDRWTDFLLSEGILIPKTTYEMARKKCEETRDKLLMDLKLLVKKVEFRER